MTPWGQTEHSGAWQHKAGFSGHQEANIRQSSLVGRVCHLLLSLMFL